MRRSRLFAFPALAAFLALGGCSPADPSGPSDPSQRGLRVVLVTLDTLRYDALEGAEGSTAMPQLAARSAGGLAFDRCYSSTSSTQPTHASIFTGLHPWQHGVSRNGQVLASGVETVAERLEAAGFETAALVASFPLAARFGFSQGFHHYDDTFDHGEVGESWEDHTKGEESFYSLAASVTDRALTRLDQMTGARQFLWVHYFDPHAPYGDGEGTSPLLTPKTVLDQASQGESAETLAAEVERLHRLYEEDVTYMDRHLERLLARLEADGGRYETHIVLTADHGESFGEDGSLAHGRRLIPSQTHVPCVILSSRVEAGSRSQEVVGSVDLGATLLRLALPDQKGSDGDAGTFGHGRDLLAGTGGPGRAFGMRRTYSEPYEDERLDGTIHVIGPQDHLFYMVDRDGTLYRGNREGLLEPIPATTVAERTAEQLRQLFARFEEELLGHAPSSTLDPEVERGLRALGYTG